MLGRNWLITLNNPTIFTQDYLEGLFNKLKATYVCGQLEKGENGTPHIQGFIHMPKNIRASAIKKVDNKLHIEIVKVNNGADDYCMKEDTRVEGPFEFGVKPVKRNSKTDWEEVKKNAIEGNIDKIPADIYVKHYRNLCQIKKDHMIMEDAPDLRGIWIYGPAGVGKSRSARDRFPGAYPKLCNKWWDGYQGQEAVIMDDVGLDHKCLGQQLKLWSDRYAVILETKGGALPSSFKTFIVTSQYKIEDIWEDKETREALNRRFKVEHMVGLQKDHFE